MKGSVKLPVFIDDARKLVNTTQLRAKYLGASYEAEYCQWQTLHGLGSLMETASLIITPNAYLEGKLLASYPPDPIGDFDVTRATTATRVNSQGLVELVPYNLFTYSSSFSNAAWGKLNATVTGGQSGYDGTTNAFLLTDDSTNAVHLIAQTPIVSGQHTVSIYAKANTLNWLWLRGVQSSANVRAWFNLSTGTVGTVETNGTANIVNVGNGWYRCELTIANHESGFEFYVGVSNADNVTSYVGSGQSLYIQNAQLVEGSTALPYQKTETRLNIPRLDYSNGTCPSILVEPQRTNLIVNSSSFSSAGWLNTNSTITSNTTTSPSGIQDADTIAFGSGGYVGQFFVQTGAYSFSVYAKYIGTQWLYLQNYNGGDFGAWFDIQNGVVGTIESGVTASIEQAENGYYRCTITYNASILSASYYVFFNTPSNGSYTRTGSSYFWGAQLEAGSYATSYIPTTSASVTRNADVISKTGISSLIGQTDGTAFIDLQVDSSFAQANARFFDISSNNYDNWYFLGLANTNELVLYFRSSATTYVSVIVPFTFGHNKIAFAYANNDYVAYVNGTQVHSTTTLSVGSTSKLTLGNEFDFSSPSKQFINASALWKTRLTNAQLATLTTI